MNVDVSPVYEFGPRIVLAVVALALGLVLARVGTGASRAYAKRAADISESFMHAGKDRREQRRASYGSEIDGMLAKAEGARRLRLIALASATLLVALIATSTGMEFAGARPASQWVAAASAASVATVSLVMWRLRGDRRAAEAQRAAATLPASRGLRKEKTSRG